ARHRVQTSGYALEQWSPIEDELLYLRPDHTWWFEAADGTDPRVVATPYSSPTQTGRTNLVRMAHGGFLYIESRWPVDAATPGDLTSPLPAGWSALTVGRIDADGGARQELLRFDPPAHQVIPLALLPSALLFATAPLEGTLLTPGGLPLHAVAMSGGPV